MAHIQRGTVVNSTLSIDLSDSWYPANVSIRTIPKEPYGMDRQALWERTDDDSFYIWGGHTADTLYLKDESLSTGSWKFQADGLGGGQWTKETPVNPTEFTELVRSEDGAFASTPHGGFWFGGWAGTRPKVHATNGDADLAPARATPGMVVYDWNNNQWSNETVARRNAFPPYGTVRGARALYVPDFGPNGIIVLLGGFMATLEPIINGSDSLYRWMDISITFMDPVTKKWYSQTATGSAPTRRQWFCMVGVSSETTYEMRKNHKQERSESGKDGRFETRDLKGLGLFDMAEWTWKNEYDASAGAYHSHEEILRSVNSVSWLSEEVMAFFVPTARTTPQPTTVPTAIPTAKETSTNAIAGAAIVAVILAVLAFLGIMWIDGQSKRPIIVPPPTPDKANPRDNTVDVPLQTKELGADPCSFIDESNTETTPGTELPTTSATDTLTYRDDEKKDAMPRLELSVAFPSFCRHGLSMDPTTRTELPVDSVADSRFYRDGPSTDPTPRSELPVDSMAGNQFSDPVELDVLNSPARL
ncbi:kelch repeat protein [Colletotrichum salicis]|uniref:Kelch repeat protein n=1 Tax=Colletotrichum salicis TaxID=1209931 RepID=A0A135V5S6_9PEZI|nr:kelch repeat protein [Colletotrichum salicis]